MTGQTISHYRILEKLGEGGMGVVYKAEDTRLRRTVAIKFLCSKTAPDAASSARFLREAQAAGGLDHPNICHVYGLEEHDGLAFIVMAYIEGASLAQKMSSGLTLVEALELAIQVGEGLKAAHGQGIVHRDIKPANILINRQGVAQITDFGLARIENRSRITMPGTVLGTVVSMAPEQIMAEDTDARTDIWAFGVLLYEMCTGRQPFQRADFESSMQAILKEDPAKPTAVKRMLPADLDWILAKALAKSRAERYQHIDDLIADLRTLCRRLTSQQETLASRRAIAAEAPTVSVRPSRWSAFARLLRRR